MKRQGKRIVQLILLAMLVVACKSTKADPDKYPVALSAEEKNHPLAKYYHTYKEISQDRIAQLQFKDSENGLPFDEMNRMLEPGYLAMENGYTKFKDGSGLVTVNTQFPGASGKMIDWWFDWVGYEVIRYKIWYPGLHAQALYEDYDNPGTYSILEYVASHPEGKTKHTIESMYEGTPLRDLYITFIHPAEFGLDTSLLGVDQWAFCAKVESGGYLVSQMVQFVRNTDEGIEMRSRFWF